MERTNEMAYPMSSCLVVRLSLMVDRGLKGKTFAALDSLPGRPEILRPQYPIVRRQTKESKRITLLLCQLKTTYSEQNDIPSELFSNSW